MEGDSDALADFFAYCHFNPLPPYGGRQTAQPMKWLCTTHFNPLPPYGGRPEGYFLSEDIEFISIHSLRMEGDFLLCNV